MGTMKARALSKAAQKVFQDLDQQPMITAALNTRGVIEAEGGNFVEGDHFMGRRSCSCPGN